MKQSTILCAVLLLFVTAQAGAISNPQQHQLQEFIEVSGLADSLASVPQQIQSAAQQLRQRAGVDARKQQVLTLLSSSWDNEEMAVVIQRVIQQHSSAEQLAGLLAWHRTALAQKFRMAEQQANSADFQQQLLDYAVDLPNSPPSDGTIKAVHFLLQSTQMVPRTVALLLQISRNMMQAAGKFNQQQDVLSEAQQRQIDASLAKYKTQLMPAIQQQITMSAYYLYRDLSNEQLYRYAAFYRSPLGQLELTLLSEAMTESLSLWATRFGDHLLHEVALVPAG